MMYAVVNAGLGKGQTSCIHHQEELDLPMWLQRSVHHVAGLESFELEPQCSRGQTLELNVKTMVPNSNTRVCG